MLYQLSYTPRPRREVATLALPRNSESSGSDVVGLDFTAKVEVARLGS
jgi:hypothetical protein